MVERALARYDAGLSMSVSIEGEPGLKSYTTENIRNIVLVGHGGAGQDLAGGGPHLPLRRHHTHGEDHRGQHGLATSTRRRSGKASLSPPPLRRSSGAAPRSTSSMPPGTRTSSATCGPRCGWRTSPSSWSRASRASRSRRRSAWNYADELDLPRMVFVNKLDRENSSFRRTLEQLRDAFGKAVAPIDCRSDASTTSRASSP